MIHMPHIHANYLTNQRLLDQVVVCTGLGVEK